MVALARRRGPLALAGILLVLSSLAAACGGSSSSNGVPSGSVARVGSVDVSRQSLAELMGRAEASYKAQKRAFPKVGSAEYAQLQQQAVAQLVQQAELRIGADEQGVGVSSDDVDKRLAQIKKQYFPTKDGKGVDEKKYQDALKKQGLSEAALKGQIEEQLREQKVYDKLTSSVVVSQADVQRYYDQNKKTLYTQPATRHIRHILVKTKPLADKLYRQLIASDARFAALAKRYSQDRPGSAQKGGDLGQVQQGQTVPAFNKVAFEIAQGVVSRPVKTQFGYHLIEALGPVTPPTTKPLDATLTQQIKTQLLQTKKQKAFFDWYQKLKQRLDKQVTYAKGYEPPKTATSTTSTT